MDDDAEEDANAVVVKMGFGGKFLRCLHKSSLLYFSLEPSSYARDEVRRAGGGCLSFITAIICLEDGDNCIGSAKAEIA